MDKNKKKRQGFCADIDISAFIFFLVVVGVLFYVSSTNTSLYLAKLFAIQGYAVSDLTAAQTDYYDSCVDYYAGSVFYNRYTGFDKFCECAAKGYSEDGCRLYIKEVAKTCVSGYLPEKTCKYDSNKQKHYVYQSYQFPSCKASEYKIKVCSDGCNENKTECLSAVCTDTDNGYELYTYGEITGRDPKTTNVVIGKDSCFGGDQLLEYYCDASSHVASRVYDCPFGCGKNKCITMQCTDSDNGKSPFRKGTVEGAIPGQAGGGSYVIGDRCIDSQILREYYCDVGGAIGSFDRECSAGCVNGACN